MTSPTLPTSAPALSIDAELAARLRPDPLAARVDSIFGRTVNLLTCDNELITLCARVLDDAPWSIRVDLAEWSAWRLTVGDPVTLAADAITLGEPATYSVTLDKPDAWYAESIELGLGTQELLARARVLAELLYEHGVAGGMRTPRGPVNVFDAEIGARLRRGRNALERAVRAGDIPGMASAITQLLGLGPGLTPAGDDFLTGVALLAAQPGSHLSAYVEAVHGVLDRHPDRTTPLSRITLREALRGRARQSLLDLLHRLLVPDGRDAAQPAEHLRVPVCRVLGIGHTSGTDLLSGLLTGLRLEAELRGSM
ncbi:DUF2877 domain-containing protein [Streptomyces sp. NPDC057611]|uniref:DUF2877 domain-containing protein n=1 Tax=Streptomyces sp. NPDC057611 TaxID=3346182 RepID=UPI00368EE168